MIFSRLAIIGPGLLGGSIALAIRERNPEVHTSIWARRQEMVDEVLEKKIADFASTDLEAVTAGAGMIIFCVPVEVMAPLAEKIAASVSPDTLITDVGSVKGPVVESLAPIFAGHARFVGSHPMAGSEQTGIGAARADLFDGAVCIVTPVEDSAEKDVEAVRQFWMLLGGQPRLLSPAEHDEVIALVSHLPHLIAATLVNLVCAQNANSLNYSGSGFRDTTRVASGSPEMWTGIFGCNRGQLKKSVHAMIEKLQEVAAFIDDDVKMKQFLVDAKTQRDRLKKGK
ncbi:MAG: prephenate dehydrogenase/arogenate dehydrogenase family protein [Chthoniobacteraceae bacterium]